MLFFTSRRKRTREAAENLLRLVRKVIHYRRDLLEEATIQELEEAYGRLSQLLKDKTQTVEAIEREMTVVDRKLKPHGGQIYPVTFWSENVEMLIVAAILAIGIRTFFVQPFKIPTNSMYPTYAGMTAEVYHADEPRPSLPQRLIRLVGLGAIHYSVEAPQEGELIIPFFNQKQAPGVVYFQMVPGRKFLVWPTTFRQYTFYVGQAPVTLKVPADFNLDDVVRETWFPDSTSMGEVREKMARNRQLLQGSDRRLLGRSGIDLAAGEPVVDFDILTGDMLFVDRLSYHFVKPKIGDAFVFRTEKIPGLNAPSGEPSEQYYIKRLVGIGGDELWVDEPVLYRNGKPIEGSDVFALNHSQEGLYPGYVGMGRLADGGVDSVPHGYYYAMGDNSPHSYDSRGWGMTLIDQGSIASDETVNFVPAEEVVGRALFIFYPLTSRWGRAQ